jgi:4-amino-4-deoxy-L-arabinose transferase-like glycosyltransferase
LPFSGRGFHVDDTLFVWAGQHIAQHPFDPYGFKINWNFKQLPMYEVTKNPPLACYYIAAVGRLVGWSERALHLAFLLPALALVLGTYRLAKRFTRFAFVAALLTLLSPGVLVSASSVMCDTMMLALWVWAVVLWIEGLDSAKSWLLLISGFLISLSALTKYFGAALIPLLLAYSLFRLRKPGRWIAYLMIPVTFLLAYQWWTGKIYGNGLLLDAAQFATSQRENTRASTVAMAAMGLSFAGGCMLPALIFAPMTWRWRQLVSGLTVAGVIALALQLRWIDIGQQTGQYLAFSARQQHWLLIGTQLLLYAAGGIFVLGLAFRDYWRRRDPLSLLLAMWVVGTWIFASFLNWTVNARSILPLIPAAGILLARSLGESDATGWPRESISRAAMAMAVCAVTALFIANADAQMANSARDAAYLIMDKLRGRTGTIWYQGHWGFQYYMESLGATALDWSKSAFKPGDVMVTPENNTDLWEISPQVVGSQRIIELAAGRWAATIQWQLGAGFYSSYWGPMPFAVGPVAPERYTVVWLKQPDAAP